MNSRGLSTAKAFEEPTPKRREHAQDAVPEKDRERERYPERHAHELLVVGGAPQRGCDQQERRQEREEVEADEPDQEWHHSFPQTDSRMVRSDGSRSC